MDDHSPNFAYSLVATAPSPATTGVSLVVTAAQGALFPTPPFNATVWPTGAQPTAATAEIVRVTKIATDTLTIVRAQESTSARTIIVGDQIAATVTAKTLTDVEAGFSPDLALSQMISLRDNTIPASTSAHVSSDYEIGGVYGPANYFNGSSPNNGNVFASPVTLPSRLTLTALDIQAGTGTPGGFGASGNMRAGVYADSGGLPGSLLYALSPKAFGATDTTVSFTASAVEVAASIWVAIQLDTSAVPNISASASVTGGVIRTTGVTYAGGLPDPFGSADFTGQALYGFFAVVAIATEIGSGALLEIT